MNTINDTTSRKRYSAPAVEVLSVRTERLMQITGSIDQVPWGSKGYGGDLEEEEDDATTAD